MKSDKEKVIDTLDDINHKYDSKIINGIVVPTWAGVIRYLAEHGGSGGYAPDFRTIGINSNSQLQVINYISYTQVTDLLQNYALESFVVELDERLEDLELNTIPDIVEDIGQIESELTQIVPKVERALLIPVATPTNPELVGIGTDKEQKRVKIGNGLSYNSTTDTLSATGGGGGYDPDNETIVLNQDNQLSVASGKFVEQTSEMLKVYGTNDTGRQTTLVYNEIPLSNVIPIRTATSQLRVPLVPDLNACATSKQYVDNQVATKQDKLPTYKNDKYLKVVNGALSWEDAGGGVEHQLYLHDIYCIVPSEATIDDYWGEFHIYIINTNSSPMSASDIFYGNGFVSPVCKWSHILTPNNKDIRNGNLYERDRTNERGIVIGGKNLVFETFGWNKDLQQNELIEIFLAQSEDSEYLTSERYFVLQNDYIEDNVTEL